MLKSNWKTTLIAVTSSIATVVGYHFVAGSGRSVVFNEVGSDTSSLNRLTNLSGVPSGTSTDFTYAAALASPSVVHIKVKSIQQNRRRPSIFDEFFGFDPEMFGPQSRQQESSGSGVIISSDGYIATNNHVIEGADELEIVTFDKRSIKGKLIGSDPSTDIAVVKIDEKDLPALVFGNSDESKVGEWVLAVGNPFNLESTVTAGIISAIGRDISILKQKYARSTQESGNTGDTPIESFIQTDAAVNPGNSGGALVNLRGELIGINTAIASPNGAYAGYSFAVPSSIVKKVTADIIRYGNVQRGYLGIVPVEINTKVAKELDLKASAGIYVNEVPEEGAAYAAGIRKGDIIEKIDGIEIKTEPKFREMIGRKRPGEAVVIHVNRDGKEKDFNVVLRNREGGKDIIKKTEETASVLQDFGIELENMDGQTKSKLGVSNGVRVKRVISGGEVAQNTDIEAGLVIVRVGNVRVNSVKDFENAVLAAKRNNEDGILVCGVYQGVSRNYCWGLAL